MGERLPSDYELFPGKMDHTTCLAVTVGNAFQTQDGDTGNSLDIVKKWTQTSVLLDIPISVNLYENEREVLVVCETPPRCNISVLVHEENIFLRVVPIESVNYKKLVGDVFIFGINEMEQPIERIVHMPCEVIPHSKQIDSDQRSGFISIRVAKKLNNGPESSIDWVTI